MSPFGTLAGAAGRNTTMRLGTYVANAGLRVLRLAGQRADIIGLAGLGRTLPDGHTHEARWSPKQVDESVELVQRAAAGRATPPVPEALVQRVELTDDRERVAAGIAELVPGLEPDHVLTAPYVFVGTPGEIADQLGAVERRWGITRLPVRPPTLDAVDAVLKQRLQDASGDG